MTPGIDPIETALDIAAIVRVQGDLLDREYLHDGARILGVADLLERALGEAPRDHE